MPKTTPVRAGEVLRVKKMKVVTDDGFIAELQSPPKRQLVVLVLGASDSGVPFDVDAMLDAMGYVPKEKVYDN